MFSKIKKFFSGAWDWIEALWEKHDDALEEMVAALLPMVIEVTFRNDLSGAEKRKAIVDAVIDNAEEAADFISESMLNEAIEVAANRYNIQIGKTTADKIDNARSAALAAGRDFANGTLKITGTEAQDAGIVIPNLAGETLTPEEISQFVPTEEEESSSEDTGISGS
jgi:hypothetical protein